MTNREIERCSSAVSLSDMEVFIFPELMYSLVLANIMSPRIWRWRSDPWFEGIRKMRPYRRMQRIRQFIMDNYVFNLDLETWGLTRQERELERFKDILSPETISSSNALFGYQGDSYYFDIDIRTHFGLDKYDSNVIPYWKTETVEAMDAFCHKPGYVTGAGECVSLGSLYAAALYIVAGIPLEKIFLMATPLHSQNFVDVDEGVLINNRRLVTKSMWFNGTQISGQARRALENERVTIVAHHTGWIHTLHRRATIAPEAFEYFSTKLSDYLKTPLTPEILGNFLRQSPEARKCFVLRWPVHGVDRYIPLDKAFSFEHESPYRVTGNTREKLMNSIPLETFSASVRGCKVVLNDIEEFVRERAIDLDNPDDMKALKRAVGDECMSAAEMVKQLSLFCHTVPDLPATSDLKFDDGEAPFELGLEMSREEIIEYVESLRGRNVTADLAFYAWRDLSRTPYGPFLKAAVERNPVSVEAAGEMSESEVVDLVGSWVAESIYDEEFRLAQPDEVWNFTRGDGFEKALTVANILRARGGGPMELRLEGGRATLSEEGGRKIVAWASSKKIRDSVWQI